MRKDEKNNKNLNYKNLSEDKESSDYFNALSPLTMFFQLAINMIIPIILCLFLGMWIDKFFDRKYFFTLIFIFLGIGASIRTMYITIMRFNKNTGKNNDKNNK